MVGIVTGNVVSAPEMRYTKDHKEYYRFQVQETSYGDGDRVGRKVWCYIWEAKDFGLVKDVEENQEVNVTGRVNTSVYEWQGKHLASMSLTVNKIVIKGAAARGASPKAVNIDKVFTPQVAEQELTGLPF